MAPTPEEAIARYEAERPRFQRAADQVAEAVIEIARGIGVVGRVTCRAKEVDSYRGKLALKSYPDPWADVTDKCGVRMILSRDSEVTLLMDALKVSDQIVVTWSEDKRIVRDPAKLEYTGVHLQVRAESEPTDLEPISCEVQLRTAAQDLWSVVSHSLLYKPAVPLPATEQHAVFRLVALTELFDLEVERIMDVIPTLPGYEYAPLIAFLETEFAGVAGTVGNKSLSAHILDGIGSLIPDIAECRRAVTDLIDGQRAELKDLYAEFGAGTAMAADFDYTLFSQPESLVILHLLESQQMALESVWAQADFPRNWLATLAAHAGTPLNPS